MEGINSSLSAEDSFLIYYGQVEELYDFYL
jgi:hypothetical protein